MKRPPKGPSLQSGCPERPREAPRGPERPGEADRVHTHRTSLSCAWLAGWLAGGFAPSQKVASNSHIGEPLF